MKRLDRPMRRLWCALTGHQGWSAFRSLGVLISVEVGGVVRCARCQKEVDW